MKKTPACVDWNRLALDLSRHMALRNAGKKIGRHGSWLYRLRDGVIDEPKFTDAVRLLDLHADVCGADATERLWMAAQ